MTKQEVRVVNTYTGQSSLNGIRRGATYLKELDGKNKAKMALFITFKSVIIVAKYAALGAGIGGAVGGVIGTVIEPGAGTIAGGFVGLEVGGGIGAAVGSVVAIKKIKVQIEQSPRYLNWKKKAIEERVFPIFNKILHGPAFENYMCAIDDQLTMIPIVTPCCTPISGLRFEKSAIEKWVVIKGKKNCPLCRAPLNQEDLVYDPDRVADIVRAARAQIALLSTREVEHAPQLQEGFTAIIEDNIDHASQIHKVQAKVEAEKALSLKSSEDEYLEAMKKIYRTQRAALGISSEPLTK